MNAQNEKCALHIGVQELTPAQVAYLIEKAFEVFVKEKDPRGLEIMEKMFPYFLQAHSMEFSN